MSKKKNEAAPAADESAESKSGVTPAAEQPAAEADAQEADGPASTIRVSERLPAPNVRVNVWLADGRKLPARTYRWDRHPDKVFFESPDGRTAYPDVAAWEPADEIQLLEVSEDEAAAEA